MSEELKLSEEDKKWLTKWLTELAGYQAQTADLLKKINNKLTFFVVLAALAILVSILLTMCK